MRAQTGVSAAVVMYSCCTKGQRLTDLIWSRRRDSVCQGPTVPLAIKDQGAVWEISWTLTLSQRGVMTGDVV